MKKIIIALVAILGMTSVAHAGGYGYKQHHNGGYGGYNGHHHHYQYRGGNGGGNDWVAPLVGGLIIGGLIGAANQPNTYYNQPMYEDYEPQLVCSKRIVGYDYNGFAIIRRFCQYQ